MSDKTELMEITPLGSAYVEALPDQKKAKRIERDFKKLNQCPASALFDGPALEKFYAERGQKIFAIYK